MRKVLFILALITSACSKDDTPEVLESIPDQTIRYFTITNGDSSYSLDVGIRLLAPGDVSDEFSLYGDSTEVRCWWLVDGEKIYSPLRVNMKGKPNKAKENYILKYEYSDN